MNLTFERNDFKKRVTSMLKVDFRRMFTTSFFYIMLGISFVVPILILVMTSMMDGMVSVDPQTGKETIMEGFDNVWQIIATASVQTSNDASAQAGMDLMSMCNINLLYFGAVVLACIFISLDFKCGYAKNLFTVRAKKTDYVLSKTVVLIICGAIMILTFFVGAMIGGAISSLSFDVTTVGASLGEAVCCLIAKMLLMAVFVPIAVLISVSAKEKTWLCILGSLGASMLLFTMVSMIAPLNASIVHVVLCVAGGATFAIGLGAISNLILNKTRLA